MYHTENIMTYEGNLKMVKESGGLSTGQKRQGFRCSFFGFQFSLVPERLSACVGKMRFCRDD